MFLVYKMRKLFLAITILLLALNFSGCANNKVHTYALSFKNIIALKNYSKSNEGVNIGEFSDSNRNESKVMCRLATPVGTQKGETFASYIQNAFMQELMISDMYNSDSNITISANLDDIYGSTMLANAYWEFKITVKSSNGNSYKVHTRYDYGSSLAAYSACLEMQRSFVPAVQKLISDIINNANFKTLIQTSDSSEPLRSAGDTLISIAEFKNLSEIPEYDWLSVGIPELASTFLSRMKGISLVERAELKRFLDERELELSGLISNSALSEMKSLLGAEYIVLGSYRVSGNNNVDLNARMIKTETGEVLRAESVAGEIVRIGELVQGLTLRMSGALGHKLTAEERTRIQQDSINMLKTIKAISQGQLFYEAGKFDKARAVYKEALRENPENAELLERIKDIDIALNAIAVVGFKNDSGKPEYDYLSNAIPEALTTSLIKNTGLPFVERLNLEKALKEMEIGMTGIIDPATAVPVGKLAGATQLVTGSFQTHDTNITVFTKIIDAENGVIVANETATGSVNSISEIANELANKLADTLRVTKETRRLIGEAITQMSDSRQKIEQILEESMVGFDFDSATLKPSSYPVLNMLSGALLRYPEYRIVIIGHTDSEGTEEHNEQLSRNRAKSVLQYMMSRGVSTDRMTSIGYGETRPRDSNDTPEGRAKNRRVEYMLIKQ
jgi:outer membrane protein OmpA-like peptidoglycan-associated protein